MPHTAGVIADPFTVAPGLIASPAVATGRRGARLRELYGTLDSHLSPQGHDVLERLIDPAVTARLSAPARRAPFVAAF